MRLHCAALLCAALVAAGCGDTLLVAARVASPAVLPVRAFPQVYVVSADDPDSEAIADRLAEHLAAHPGPASARLLVWRLSAERLAALRASERVEAVSVVIRVRLLVDEEERPDFSSRPTTVCGPGGCYLGARPFPGDIPTLRARACFTVEDGPSGRVLQEAALETRDEGTEPLSMRGRAVLELAGRAPGLVDGQVRAVDVPLVEVDDAAAQRALSVIARGDWAGGARLLARLVAAPGFARRPRAARAALLFDLGQARRFAGPEGAAALPRLERAAEALRAALRLEPRVLYANIDKEVR